MAGKFQPGTRVKVIGNVWFGQTGTVLRWSQLIGDVCPVLVLLDADAGRGDTECFFAVDELVQE